MSASAPPPFDDGGARRPALARRVGAGAWHVVSGFAFLLRRPSFWPLAALPSAVAVASLGAGLVVAAYLIPWLEQALLPGRGKAPVGVVLLLTVALWVGTFAAGLVAGLAVAFLLTAPLLDRLSRKVEAYVRVEVADQGAGLTWELAQSFRGALYFLGAAPGVLLLSVIPLVGPVLGLVWGAHALAVQQTDMALTRRGFDFTARRAWHRRWRPESMGFGLAGLFALLAPCANLVLAPALTVGGTLFVLELEEDLAAPDLPERRREPRTTNASLPASE
jgi:uncharacterized protein involved in cysteine biosynthesis